MHHKHIDKHEGESFGMLLVAKKYWDKVLADKRRQINTPFTSTQKA
jgi:beta-carotene 3-hydroxylase